MVLDVDGRAAFELGGGSETPTRVVPSEGECFRVGRGFDVGRDCLVVAGACDGWQPVVALGLAAAVRTPRPTPPTLRAP